MYYSFFICIFVCLGGKYVAEMVIQPVLDHDDASGLQKFSLELSIS